MSDPLDPAEWSLPELPTPVRRTVLLLLTIVMPLVGLAWLFILDWKIGLASLLWVGGCLLLFERSARARLGVICEMLGSHLTVLGWARNTPEQHVINRVRNLERESGIHPSHPLGGDMPPRATVVERLEVLESRRPDFVERLEAIEEGWPPWSDVVYRLEVLERKDRSN